jgi:hypothetical protein
MIRFSLHNRQVEIPLQGMEFVCFSTRGGLWGLRIVNLFMPPPNKLCLNSIDFVESSISCKGIYRKNRNMQNNLN